MRCFGLLAVAMLAIGANGAAIMAALPTTRANLALDTADVQWAVNAYLVVSAACIVLGGDASDRFGARRVVVAGLVPFAAASATIALSTCAAMLLTGRSLQGLASALAVPSTLAALGTVIPPERRAAAMAAWTGFLMLGFSIGPMFGGAVTRLVGWRVIFWLNIAMMGLATTGMAAGAEGARAARTHTRGTHWGGYALLATFMIALVFGPFMPCRVSQARRSRHPAPLPSLPSPEPGLLSLERRVAPQFVRDFFSLRRFATSVALDSVSMFCIMALLLYFNLSPKAREGSTTRRSTPVQRCCRSARPCWPLRCRHRAAVGFRQIACWAA